MRIRKKSQDAPFVRKMSQSSCIQTELFFVFLENRFSSIIPADYKSRKGDNFLTKRLPWM